VSVRHFILAGSSHYVGEMVQTTLENRFSSSRDVRSGSFSYPRSTPKSRFKLPVFSMFSTSFVGDAAKLLKEMGIGMAPDKGDKAPF
jgi:hypothetical protein